jgi:uncharacterized protein YgiM (DUF1202 family)
MKKSFMKSILSAALLVAAFAGTAKAELEEGDAAVARAKVALRERPGSDYRVIGRIEAGDSVTVDRVKGEWVKVKAGSRAGWAPQNVFTQGHAKARKGEDESSRARKKAFVSDGQFARRANADDEIIKRAGKKRGKAAAADDDSDTVSDDDGAADEKVTKAKAAKWKTTKSKATAKREEAADDEIEEPRSRRAKVADEDAAPAEDEKPAKPAKVAKRSRSDDDGDADDEEKPAKKVKKQKDIVGTKVAANGKTPLRREPSDDAPKAMVAHDGDEMKVLKKKGDWLLVEIDGEKGWVESARVKSLESDGEEDELVGRQGGGYMLGAGLGFVSMTQDFSSDANVFLSKYRIASAAGAVAISGVYSYITGIWEFAGDGNYRFTAATPGIEVTTMGGQREDLSVLEHSIDVGGRLGYRSGDGMKTGLYTRFGYHLDSLQIDQSKLAPLPSENISGFTIGGGLDIPALSEHFSACAHFDFMFSGARDQTVGLRDGRDNGTQGILLGAALGYRFGDAWAMTGGYNMSYMTTSFTGPSERLMNQGTWGLRSNLDHILMVGLNYVAR